MKHEHELRDDVVAAATEWEASFHNVLVKPDRSAKVLALVNAVQALNAMIAKETA